MAIESRIGLYIVAAHTGNPQPHFIVVVVVVS